VNASPSNGKFNASSSISGISISKVTGPVSVSLSGSSLPTSATLTTTGEIKKGTVLSATLTATWSVNSSITPTPPTGKIEVQSNHAAASFSLSGPVIFNGGGKLWTQEEAPVGEYTINFNTIPGYSTPPQQKGTLNLGGKLGFNGQYNPLNGAIDVLTNLQEANFTLSGPEGRVYNGSGTSWSTSSTLIGDYTISYSDIINYEKPLTETKTLTTNDKITFNGQYKKLTPGIIEVHTNLDESAFDLIGPVNYSGTGMLWKQTDAAVGSYMITYKAVSGYETPPSESNLLPSGGNLTFNAEYKKIIPGTIIVNTNLDDANFEIKGAKNYSGTGKSFTQVEVPLGFYTITYGNVTDYGTPSSETKKMTSGGTVTFNAEYKAFIGTINVRTNLTNATFKLSGRAEYEGSGTDWIKLGAPVGEYTVTFNNVPKYETPPPITQKLISNSTTTFNAEYREVIPGTIEVKTNTNLAKFTISGTETFQGTGSSWNQAKVLPGEYTITYDDVPDYEKPASETKVMSSDGSILFKGDYKIHTGKLIVNSNIDGASFKINGTNVSYSGNGKSWTQTNAPIGLYTISYDDVLYYDKPLSETKELKYNEEIAFTGTYNPVPSKIQKVTVSGSPAKANSSLGITVNTDPKCSVTFSIEGFASGALTELSNNGVYTTSFKSPSGIDVKDVPINIKVKNPMELESTDSSQKVTIDTLAKITSVTLSNKTAAIGEPVMIEVVGDPKGFVSFSISGVIQSQMIEEPKNPGTYIGGFIVMDSMKKGSSNVEIQLMDAVGNIAINSDTIITIYTPIPGEIKVRTNLENAKFKITGTDEYTGSGKLWVQTGAKPGVYTITYEDVADYETPSSETKILTSEGLIAFIGGYKALSGTIRVSTNLNEASFKITGPEKYNGSGKEWEKKQAPIGEYTITYLDVTGYETPAPETKVLYGGCDINFNANYISAVATIIVRTNLDSASFKLTGPATYEGNGKYFEINDAIPGEYTIEYKEAIGYQKPLPETKIVANGGSIAFIGGYAVSETPASPVFVNFQNALIQNYPNPCNPGTWIPFTLAEGGDVSIAIYDTNGRVVRKLELGYKNPGTYLNTEKSAYWDGCNEYGEKIASGIYFYHIRSGKFSATRRMLISR
jgi:hypothetical protein